MFLIRATVSVCRAPITDLRFAAFPVLTGNTRPFSEDRPRPMARSLSTVCLVVGLTLLGALPAAAQFNPFEALFGSPPRPPGQVPGGRQVPTQQGYPQYPDDRYPDRRTGCRR